MVSPGIVLSGSERARSHALKAECQRAARLAGAYERSSVEERDAPRRAVVVHVRNWDAREAELVECGLATCRGAVDIADECRLDGIVGDS